MEHDVLQRFELNGNLPVCLNLRKENEIIHH